MKTRFITIFGALFLFACIFTTYSFETTEPAATSTHAKMPSFMLSSVETA